MRKSALLALLAVAVGLAVFTVQAAAAETDPLALSDDDLLFTGPHDAIETAQQQRSLLQSYGAPAYPPTYCYNSHIKPVFTAKVAVLLMGLRRRKIGSADYVNLIKPRIAKRLKRYNRRYKRNLTFVITQNSSGLVKYKHQKWFYFDVKFVVGTCGRYKFPLITQLRGEIQPSAGFIKRVRLMTYPYKN